jgi:hypothetical protein
VAIVDPPRKRSTSQIRADFPKSKRVFVLDSLALLSGCVLVLFFSLPNLRIPFLGRDEAFYAYFGERVSGLQLYRGLWEMHFPALYYVYALAFHLPGGTGMQHVRVIHMLVQVLGGIAFYSLLRRFLRPGHARIGAVAYVAFALSPLLEGDIANTEPFALPFLLASFAIAQGERSSFRDFVSGLLIGVAASFKQNCMLFALVIPVGDLLAGAGPLRGRFGREIRRLPALMAGCVAPIAIIAAVFAKQHLLGAMFDCTISFPLRDRLQDSTLLKRVRDTYRLWKILPNGHPFLVIGGLAGLAYLRRTGGRPPAGAAEAPAGARKKAIWLATWLTVAVLLAASSGRAFPHYLEMVAPPLCALGFLAIQALKDVRRRPEAFAALFALCGLLALDVGASVVRGVLLYSSGNGSRGAQDGARAALIGGYIRERTTPDQRIFVWGPLPAVYHFAERSAPTRYVNLSAIARPYIGRSGDQSAPGAMQELRRDLERTPPEFIVLIPTMQSFEIDQPHFQWLRDLLSTEYRPDRTFGGECRLFRRLPYHRQ